MQHQEARLIAELRPYRRRRGEPDLGYHERVIALHEERNRRAREAFDIAEAARRAVGHPRVTGPHDLPRFPRWIR